MNKYALGTVLGTALLGFLKSEIGSKAFDSKSLVSWNTWTEEKFNQACKEVIDSLYDWNMYVDAEKRSWLIDNTKYKSALVEDTLWQIYPIFNYALAYKNITRDALKVARRVSKLKSFGYTAVERLINTNAFDIQAAVRQALQSPMKISESQSSENSETLYTIGQINIINANNLSGDKKEQLDRVLKKTQKILQDSELPMFTDILDGLDGFSIVYQGEMSGKLIGGYNRDNDVLQLRTWTNKVINDDKYINTLIHELAHRVHFKRLNPEQTSSANLLYQQLNYELNRLISNWSTKGADLGFKFNDKPSHYGNAKFKRFDEKGYVWIYYQEEPNNEECTWFKKRGIYNRVKDSMEGNFPSYRSKLDEYELFAEMARLYILHPQEISQDLKSKFLEIINLKNDTK